MNSRTFCNFIQLLWMYILTKFEVSIKHSSYNITNFLLMSYIWAKFCCTLWYFLRRSSLYKKCSYSGVLVKYDPGIYYDRTLSYTFEFFWKVSSYCDTNFLFRWSRVVTFVVHLIVNKKKNLSYTQLVDRKSVV